MRKIIAHSADSVRASERKKTRKCHLIILKNFIHLFTVIGERIFNELQ